MTQSQYATTTDLQNFAITTAAGSRFGTTAMNAALQAASSLADSYLVSQFTLPIKTSPQGWDMSLTLNVCAVAAWLLYNQFGFSPQAPGDEFITKRYESAIDWLKQIRDKKIFPQYVDSSSNTGTDEAGDFIVSDSPVGFTSRGVTNSRGLGSDDPWGLDD